MLCSQRCNLGMVDLEKLVREDDIQEVRALILEHQRRTGSQVAERVLADWDEIRPQFVKVMPIDYRRVLLQRAASQRKEGVPGRRS